MVNGSCIYAYKTNDGSLMYNSTMRFHIIDQAGYCQEYYKFAPAHISSVVNIFNNSTSNMYIQEDRVYPVGMTFQFRGQTVYKSG